MLALRRRKFYEVLPQIPRDFFLFYGKVCYLKEKNVIKLSDFGFNNNFDIRMFGKAVMPRKLRYEK